MTIWGCKVCGLLTIGAEPPERCVVCGASSEKSTKVDTVPDISGTQTEKNMKMAFSGESQANRRYLLFARIAEMEGDKEAEDLFLRFAYEETWHALSHLMYLLGKTTTGQNIAKSIEGETYEAEKMYKEFAGKAKEEGFDEVALIFDWLAKVEGNHAKQLSELRART